MKVPTKDSRSGEPGRQTEQNSAVMATDNTANQTGLGFGTGHLTVLPAQPGITTAATTTAALGSPITDTAALTAAVPPGPPPTGTITFALFGPANATCTGTPRFTSTATVAAAGRFTSMPYTPTAVGTYRWIASYSGDNNNAAATNGCGDRGEISTVTATVPPTTQPPAGADAIKVTKNASPATRPSPGGTFTFTVTVLNPSGTYPVKITALVDDIYGNLATRAGSTCGSLIGVTLAPGATSSPCSFTGTFSGVGGASQTDTVTVTGVGGLPSTTVTAMATATVGITPGITSLILTGIDGRLLAGTAAGLTMAALVLLGIKRRAEAAD